MTTANKFPGSSLLIQRSVVAVSWAPTTAYAIGQYVSNSGNIYRCATAGTSAASGGPTTTGTGISDGAGGLTWNFVVATGGFITVACMRKTDFTVNNEAVDITNKTDGAWKQIQNFGVQSMSIGADGPFTDDTSHNLVMQDVMNKSIVPYKIITGRGDVFTGSFFAQSIQRTGEYNKEEQFALKLESAAAITYTPSPT